MSGKLVCDRRLASKGAASLRHPPKGIPREGRNGLVFLANGRYNQRLRQAIDKIVCTLRRVDAMQRLIKAPSSARVDSLLVGSAIVRRGRDCPS